MGPRLPSTKELSRLSLNAEDLVPLLAVSLHGESPAHERGWQVALQTPPSHIGIQVIGFESVPQYQLLAIIHALWEAVLWSLTPSWETHKEFWISGFQLAQTHLCQAFGK